MAVYLGSNEVNLRGGQPMENGLPSGGLTGQVLAKSSNDDYVAAWTTVYDVPAGGSVGQVLAKSSDDDYALTWTSIESDPALPSGGLNGQVLAKSSNDDYAVAWSTLPPGEFVITVTQTSTTGSGTFSMNRTTGQIKTAIESGQHVVVYFRFTAYSQFNEPGDRRRFPYKQTQYGYYEFEDTFIDISGDSTQLNSYLFKISTTGSTITLTRNKAYGVTGGNSNYVGKFLGAAEGYAVPVYPQWQTIYQVPAGGSNGQFLKKTGNGSADYAWADLTVNSASFVVTFTNNQGIITADKTINELLDALDAHQRPIGFYQPDHNSYATYMLPNYTQFGGHYYFSGEINLGYNNIENISIDLNGMNTYKQYRRITYNINTDDSYATYGPSDTEPLRELFMESSLAPPEVLPTALVYNNYSNSDGYACYVASYISNAYNDNNEFEGKIEFIRHGVVNSGSGIRLCIQSFTLTHNLDTGNITYTSVTTKYINFDT